MEDSSKPQSNETSRDQPNPSDVHVNKEIESENGCGQEPVDLELEALLDSSLADFGKHVPKPNPQDTPIESSDVKSKGSGTGLGSLFDGLKGLEDGSGGDDEIMKEMEQVFGEEFARQAEAQLTEAMDMLKFDNPELLNQFEELVKKVGLEEDCSPPDSQGKEPTQGDGCGQPKTDHTFQSAVEDTVRRLQESTKPSSATPTDITGMEDLSKLTEMMGGINLGENGEGEEQVMKMMEGMMNTLLSKEVLYPSLVDFCRQYPEWLDRHSNSLSPEDRTRYVHQLEIMKEICSEFEKENGSPDSKERQDKILQLMQELQKYGQPPEDLGGMPLPPSPFGQSSTDDNQCGMM